MGPETVKAWIEPSWLPGVSLGVLCVVYGVLAAVARSETRFSGWFVRLHWMLLLISIVMFVAGVIAFFVGQPPGVWESYVTGGFVGFVILSSTRSALSAMSRARREAEQNQRDRVDPNRH